MYERPRICGVVYTDTMDGQHKSLEGDKFAQVFAMDFHFSAVYPMESKGHAGDALKQFITDFGFAGQNNLRWQQGADKKGHNIHGAGQETSH